MANFEEGVNVLSAELEENLLDPRACGRLIIKGQGLGSQLIPNTFTYIPTNVPLEVQKIVKEISEPRVMGLSPGNWSGLYGSYFTPRYGP